MIPLYELILLLYITDKKGVKCIFSSFSAKNSKKRKKTFAFFKNGDILRYLQYGRCESLAQSVEHRPFKAGVQGSSP